MSSSQTQTLTLKDRLEELGCPLIEDLDDDAVDSLLLQPGEGRLQILHWLLGSFHPKLTECLESTTGNRPESKLQNLLVAANAMLLCSKNDIALIRGDVSVSRQLVFLNHLLELCDQSQRLSMKDSFDIRPADLTRALGNSDLISAMNTDWKPDILPKDIRSELSKRQDWENSKLPSLKTLMEMSDQLSEELSQHSEKLKVLQTTVRVQGLDQRVEVTSMTQLLTNLVKELTQLTAGFSACFESRLGLWCKRAPPQLSELGPTLGRVHDRLGGFIKLFEVLNAIRNLQTKLQKSQPKQEIQQALGSEEATEILEKCLPVLEESLHRNDATFVSKYESLLDDRFR